MWCHSLPALTAPGSMVRSCAPTAVSFEAFRQGVMIFAGGVPLKRDGKVVGAIGVSGGSVAQDQAVAEAGTAAFK